VELERPVLVFDGDCALCSTSVRLLERMVRRRPTIIAWQHATLSELGLTQAQCEEAVQWVEVDGTVLSAHHAVGRTLTYGGRGWWLIGRVITAPGVQRVSGAVYRWVARNRHRLPGGTPACSLPQAERDGG
jgi:predicted DCC family thiol-disulfide oxidoreductase YuxK